jgi:two-component system response regulator NreC
VPSPDDNDSPSDVETIRLMLADGPELTRSALAALLGANQRIEIVAASSGRDDALRAAAGHKPDAILYHPDSADKPQATAEAISALTEASGGARLIVLADTVDSERARAALREGVAGYILQSDDPDELIRAIIKATVTSPRISPAVTLAIAVSDRDDGPSWLSQREQQIVRLIAFGHTNAEVASELHLSVRTVESHRSRILSKLDLKTRAELVLYAIDSGIFDPSQPPKTD